MIIANRDALTSHGNVEGRKMVLDILEAGFQAADPYENVRRLIRIQDNTLIVGCQGFPVEQPRGHFLQYEPLTFDLSEVGHIYVVGGGKAAQRMAQAMEDVLGPLITEGQVNAKKGEPLRLKWIHVTFAGHPTPDEESVEGSRRILAIEQKARKGDLVFFAESGGGTALMALPAPGVTLKDLQDVNRLLYFEHGASMGDANAVRWLLMTLRGRHERHVGDATLIAVHTDEVPRRPDHYQQKRPPSPSRSYSYAIDILKKYGIWDEVSPAVRAHLLKADPQYDRLRPEEVEGKPYYHFCVMNPEYMLKAASEKAKELGIHPAILTSSLNNLESRVVTEVQVNMALEVETYGRPFAPPCALICGGELLVTVGKATGMGGRNQEFVLSAAPLVSGSENIVVASADSDGTDGPTNSAGGIVDGYTITRAQEQGVDVLHELANHNAYCALRQLGDDIVTGAQGTNVRDLRVIFVHDRLRI